jgi:hypothetical protein
MATTQQSIEPSPRVDSLTVDEQTKRSVDAIIRLHGIVIALALTTATTAFVKPLIGSAAPPLTVDTFLSPLSLQYITLLVTVIPFYHGANRHMDVAHVFAPAHRFHALAIMLDFLLLFAEAIEFFALALSLGDTKSFQFILFVLIVTDTIWGFISLTTAKDTVSTQTIGRWLGLNAAFFLWLLAATRASIFSPDAQPGLICAAAIVRTVADYALNRRFYFNIQAHG